MLIEKFIPDIEKGLAERIKKYIENDLSGFVKEQIKQKETEIMAMPASSVAELIRKYCDRYKEIVWEKYCGFIDANKSIIAENVDIRSIVEDKINEMDPRDVEKTITDLANRELSALIYLGGVIGFLLGIINIFI